MSRRQAGFTFVEVLIAMAIFVFISYGMMTGFSFIRGQTDSGKDKSFATQKVNQMMEELRSLLDTPGGTIGVLDEYNDNPYPQYNYILTTVRDVVRNGNPADPLSGNGGRRYVRTIQIERVPNDPQVRRVTVTVYLDHGKHVLSQAVTLLRTVGSLSVGAVVYRYFTIGINNVPGWRGLADSACNQLQFGVSEVTSSNLGLQMAGERIQFLSYGRDPFYRPYINVANRSDNLTDDNAMAYYYPGWVNAAGTGPFDRYFQNINGPHLADGVPISGPSWLFNDESLMNQLGGTISDQYNHGVRYPDEARIGNLSWTQTPTLRAFIEGLNQNLPEYRNSIIFNAHGDVLPVSPMRNYSDAAKKLEFNDVNDHLGIPYARAVTHPENLEVASTADPVKLRVYTYIATHTPAGLNLIPSDGSVFLPEIIVTLIHPGVNSLAVRTDLAIPGRIRKLIGNSATTPYSWENAEQFIPPIDFALVQSTISINSIAANNITVIRLFNSPLRHQEHPGMTGLNPGNRLYGLEYIPCLVDGVNFAENTRDLAEADPPLNNIPKNTARWTLTIGGGVLSQSMITVETRIGSDPTTGIRLCNGCVVQQPTNLSRTYVWVSYAVPFTERYQFMGDPRHMPYADVKARHGYNWYFGPRGDALTAAGYEDFDKVPSPANPLLPGLWDGRLNVDVPRYMEVWRRGLMASRSFFVNPAGRAFSWLSLGGEFGFGPDQGPDFEDGLSIREFIWNPGAGGNTEVDEINGDIDNDPDHTPDFEGLRLIASRNNEWYGRYWLGELYPDDRYKSWTSTGNLIASRFYRAPFTLFGLPQNNRLLGYKGAASFFNGGEIAGRYFAHADDCVGSCLDTVATDPAIHFYHITNLTIPDVAHHVIPAQALRAAYPFTLNENSPLFQPPEWLDAEFAAASMRTRLTPLTTYYEPPGLEANYNSSAVIRFSTASETAGIAVINGFSTLALDEFAIDIDIGRTAVVTALEANFTAGDPALNSRVTQMPMIRISTPVPGQIWDNPSTIPITVSKVWRRWDDQRYTSLYPHDFADPEPLEFMVIYSTSSGRRWLFLDDNTTADVSIFNRLHTTTVLNSGSLYWNVSDPVRFPGTKYDLRIYACRENFRNHSAYKSLTFSITRPSP